MEFRNFFLGALLPDDISALTQSLKEVSLTRGQVLFEAEDPVETLYFPSSACLSVVAVMRDGRAIETATIGRESATPLLDAFTGKPSKCRIFAQIGGAAVTLPAKAFRKRLEESPALLRMTLLHARANAFQSELGVACNLLHSAQARLARWLLMTQDRTGGATFPLTQEYMAIMTGVQRTTISHMAGEFKRAKVINYARGLVDILDRPALLKHACECYSQVEDQFDELAAEKL